jgi:glycosyltransferase involved in cell wall biosynthesis
MNPPLLTVIAPVYGVEKYLDAFIRSIREQTLESLEFLIIDDASTDASAAIARHHATIDPRVTVVVHDSNQGLGAARNTGLARARGKYVTFPDSDDLVPRDAYQAMTSSLEATGSSFVTGPVEELNGREVKGYWTTQGNVFLAKRESVTLKEHPELVRDHTAWNKVFRSDFLRDQGLAWPTDTISEDIVPSVEAYCAADSIDVLATTVYFYRRRSGSIMSIAYDGQRVAEWCVQTEQALRTLIRAGQVAAAEEFAAKVLRSEFPRRSSALPDSAGASRAAQSALSLVVECAPDSALVSLHTEMRWVLALTTIGQSSLLPWVVERAPHGDLTLPDINTPYSLDPRLERLLGLGQLSLLEAFSARFVEPRLTTRVPHTTHDLVSVIVPVRNVEAWLPDCLASVLASTHPQLEVIVVDDGSTDDTVTIARHFAATDPRVTLIHAPGSGSGQARNAGIDVAQGKYLAFCDGDDLVPPHAYATMMEAAQASAAQLVVGNFLKLGTSSTRDIGTHYGLGVTSVDTTLADNPQLIRYRTCWNRLIDRELWIRCQAHFPAGPRSNDLVPITLVLTQAERISMVSEPVYVYRERPGATSMTSTLSEAASVLSHLKQELLSSSFVMRTGDPGVIRTYWRNILRSDVRTTLEHYLRSAEPDSSSSTEVTTAFRTFLAAVPHEHYSELEPQLRLLYALMAHGNAEVAAALVTTRDSRGLLPLGLAHTALQLTANSDWLDVPTRSWLFHQLIVRAMYPMRAELSPALLTDLRATTSLLRQQHRLNPVPIPGTNDHKILAVLDGADDSGLPWAVAKPQPLRATHAIFTKRGGEVRGHWDDRLPAVTSVMGTLEHEEERIRMPLGVLERQGHEWRVRFDPSLTQYEGRWALEMVLADGSVADLIIVARQTATEVKVSSAALLRPAQLVAPCRVLLVGAARPRRRDRFRGIIGSRAQGYSSPKS